MFWNGVVETHVRKEATIRAPSFGSVSLLRDLKQAQPLPALQGGYCAAILSPRKQLGPEQQCT